MNHAPPSNKKVVKGDDSTYFVNIGDGARPASGLKIIDTGMHDS